MTFVVVARYRTRSGAENTVLPLLDTVAAASRLEPGNLAYRVHQGTEDPRAIVLYEEYASEADFAAHCATPHFQEIVLGKVVPLLESRDVLRCAPRGEVDA
ncbi:putative quinol monooxygenase [Streptomyces formicae]|uniref:ABM domain-containing protein n=1 Tax=Streptomyces formicae TaxID=1616117 RepID=A0A291Q1B8_9ACTN|nr:putative quinol monooxygenase [Streptomyces formicae]ATL25520.1 hypothetical protein KY5_0502 [Streptomyces formicae]